METFSDYSVWGTINLIAVLLLSLLAANIIKKTVPLLRVSLIPTSVLGGAILLIISLIYSAVTDKYIFNTGFFGGNGQNVLEIITYHMLALGFIATSFKPVKKKLTKRRTKEIFDTGVTTVSTYLLQGVLGMGITILFALGAFAVAKYAGILLPFGYGQGTGQALNWGGVYEADYGFIGGKSFGLTIAAFGFISASIGGVIHLNILRKKGHTTVHEEDEAEALVSEGIQEADEIPMSGSMDKMSVQIAFVFAAYVVSYGIMYLLAKFFPGLTSVIYGFNFLFGVLVATLFCVVINHLRRAKIVRKQYINSFLMDRIGGFCFDIMVIAGVAAIRIEALKSYWLVLLTLGLAGAFVTYFYLRFVARKLFSRYSEEQFLMMYGMLTGTACTGIILLREKDPEFKTPASDNLVYQNVPAMVFGFPLMLIANLAPQHPYITIGILAGFFLVLNIILFRPYIFGVRRRRKKRLAEEQAQKMENK